MSDHIPPDHLIHNARESLTARLASAFSASRFGPMPREWADGPPPMAVVDEDVELLLASLRPHQLRELALWLASVHHPTLQLTALGRRVLRYQAKLVRSIPARHDGLVDTSRVQLSSSWKSEPDRHAAVHLALNMGSAYQIIADALKTPDPHRHVRELYRAIEHTLYAMAKHQWDTLHPLGQRTVVGDATRTSLLEVYRRIHSNGWALIFARLRLLPDDAWLPEPWTGLHFDPLSQLEEAPEAFEPILEWLPTASVQALALGQLCACLPAFQRQHPSETWLEEWLIDTLGRVRAGAIVGTPRALERWPEELNSNLFAASALFFQRSFHGGENRQQQIALLRRSIDCAIAARQQRLRDEQVALVASVRFLTRAVQADERSARRFRASDL